MVAKKKVHKRKVSLGEMADNYYQRKQDLKIANAAVTSVKKELAEMEEGYIKVLEEQGLKSIKGQVGNIILTECKAYTVEDYEKLLNFIIKNKLFHFFQRSVVQSAVIEYLETNTKVKKIPGLKKSEWSKLRCVKA